MNIKTVCVFCGSHAGKRPEYRMVARQLGTTLAQRGMRLVYGGSGAGSMLDLADAALEAGGKVVGVIPKILVDREQAHQGVTELHVVNSLQERKTVMSDLSDAFIALPGGLGTLDQILEMLTWSQLGIQHKPCGFLNTNRYFTKLIEFFDVASEEGFLRPDYRALTFVSDDVEHLLAKLEGTASH